MVRVDIARRPVFASYEDLVSISHEALSALRNAPAGDQDIPAKSLHTAREQFTARVTVVQDPACPEPPFHCAELDALVSPQFNFGHMKFVRASPEGNVGHIFTENVVFNLRYVHRIWLDCLRTAATCLSRCDADRSWVRRTSQQAGMPVDTKAIANSTDRIQPNSVDIELACPLSLTN